eukprot:5041509-Amphidinium_carterae.1
MLIATAALLFCAIMTLLTSTTSWWQPATGYSQLLVHCGWRLVGASCNGMVRALSPLQALLPCLVAKSVQLALSPAPALRVLVYSAMLACPGLHGMEQCSQVATHDLALCFPAGACAAPRIPCGISSFPSSSLSVPLAALLAACVCFAVLRHFLCSFLLSSLSVQRACRQQLRSVACSPNVSYSRTVSLFRHAGCGSQMRQQDMPRAPCRSADAIVVHASGQRWLCMTTGHRWPLRTRISFRLTSCSTPCNWRSQRSTSLISSGSSVWHA